MRQEQWIGDLAPEPEPPKPGRWIARPKKPRWVLQLGVMAGIMGQAPNWLHLLLKPWLGETGSWLGVLAVVLLVLGLFGLFALRERIARRMRLEDQALVDGVFGDQYPAEVTIVARGKRLGTDRGVLWFEDGLMGFSGSSASFVLAPRDVVVRRAARPKRKDRSGLPANSVALVDAPVPGYLLVHALGKGDAALRERLRRYEEETAPLEAERFWPPLEPYSESLARYETERSTSVPS